MAVYQGARRASPSITLPGVHVPGLQVPALPRRRTRTAVRARRSNGRVGVALAAIVVAFAAAFFSLTQDVRVSAIGYEIDRLQIEREQLLAREQDLRSELNRLGKAPAVRKLAIDIGLAPLREPIVIPAR
ncbi:MAG TPA: hypothetical protein VFK54_04530 [Candidatus Limnocylindrales bacterium]|nr:hypothetical protein [Candidatus Limnocylindrales bacterium]